MLTQRRIFIVINYLCKKPRTNLKLVTFNVRESNLFFKRTW